MYKIPEIVVLPAYINSHFAKAQIVLDLGFGNNIWFWASFLPSLKKIDGIDISEKALKESEKILNADKLPSGYKEAHETLGSDFKLKDLHNLKNKKGNLIVQDYKGPWPGELLSTRYDLITEYDSFSELNNDQDFKNAIKKAASLIKPNGYLMLMDFKDNYISPHLNLSQQLYLESIKEAKLELINLHTITKPEGMLNIEQFFYGFAQKLSI